MNHTLCKNEKKKKIQAEEVSAIRYSCNMDNVAILYHEPNIRINYYIHLRSV